MRSSGFVTGCSMHSRNTTAAIVVPNEHVKISVLKAEEALDEAKKHNNSSVFVMMTALDGALQGVMLADLRRVMTKTATAYDESHLIVSVSDIGLLRFYANDSIGEFCRVPECIADVCSSLSADALNSDEVDRVIACLMRDPPVSFEYDSDLPMEWEDHVNNRNGWMWISDLWEQSKSDYKNAKDNAKDNDKDNDDKDDNDDDDNSRIPPRKMESPFDVISLAMYTKLASGCSRTSNYDIRSVVSSVTGSMETGLMDVFTPSDDALDAPSMLTFMSNYLIGDSNPWELTTRGRRAAAVARRVTELVFDHMETVAHLLKTSEIACMIRPMPTTSSMADATIVMHDNEYNIMNLISNRIPVSATSSERGFVVSFDDVPADVWIESINKLAHDIVEYATTTTTTTKVAAATTPTATTTTTTEQQQKQQQQQQLQTSTMRLKDALGAFAALSSMFLEVDDSLIDSRNSHTQSLQQSVVSTFPSLCTAHLTRKLVVRPDTIKTRSVSATVLPQAGNFTSHTIVTYCDKTASSLWSPQFDVKSLSDIDISVCQEEMDLIAKAMQTVSDPLGVFVGTVGGVVTYEGRRRRAVGWKRRGEAHDMYLSLFDATGVELLFADYACEDRELRMDFLENELTNGPKTTPFMATHTTFVISDRSILPNTNMCLFKLRRPKDTAMLNSDAPKVKRLLTQTQTGQTLSSNDGLVAFNMRESQNDRLAGLCIGWSVAVDSKGTRYHLLSSANSRNEVVAF